MTSTAKHWFHQNEEAEIPAFSDYSYR
jgi:hypothetical protein